MLLLLVGALAFIFKQGLNEQLAGRIIVAIIFTQAALIITQIFIAFRLMVYLGGGFSAFWVAFRGTLFSQGLEAFVPWRLPDLIRIAFIRYRGGYSTSLASAAVVMERLGDILIILFLSVVATLLLGFEVSLWQLIALGALLILGILAFSLFDTKFLWLLKKIPIKRLRELTIATSKEFISAIKTKRFFVGFGFGCLSWVFTFFSVWIYLHISLDVINGGPELHFWNVLQLLVLVILGGSIAVLPAGFGTFEAAAILGLTKFGIATIDALPLAIGLHLAFLLPGIIGGGMVFIFEDVSLKQLTKDKDQ